MNRDELFQWSNIFLVSLWLGVFSLIPHIFVILTSVSLSDATHALMGTFTLKNYLTVFLDPLYLKVFWRSFKLAALCTVICLFIAYPFAYLLSQLKLRYKSLFLIFILLPFWTSSLVRTYAIVSLLKVKGLLNTILMGIGLIQEPLQLLHTNTAVIIGLVYELLPFMILPLFNSFEKLDQLYVDAARDLGASRTTIFLRIIIPLTLSGIFNGSLLVFLPAMTLFYIPDILGGAKSLFLGNLIQRQFLMDNWPLGAALSVILISLLIMLLSIGRYFQKKHSFYQQLL